jgi:hypothetical protein
VANIQLTVVSNSSPLIYLAKIDRLRLLKDVYGRIWIPEAVFNEAVTQEKILGITDASIIEEAVGRWILKERIKPKIHSRYGFLDKNERMGLGEKQALMLCKQLNADIFIVDDKEARRVARILKVKPVGTLGVLINARKNGLISAEEAEQTLDQLVKAGFRIDPVIYSIAIKKFRQIFQGSQ